MTPNASLLIIDAHGIYIPQYFAEQYFPQYVTNKDRFTAEDLQDLTSPENEHYWEAWEEMLDNAELTDDKQRKCSLYQNGDLWAIPEDELELIPEDC